MTKQAHVRKWLVLTVAIVAGYAGGVPAPGASGWLAGSRSEDTRA